jgi:site-specific recombinase XerD
MELAAALTELAYAKDWSPSSRRWFTSRLGAFFSWAEDQGITELERVTAPLVRRYVDERRTSTSRTGKPLDSHTLNGHVRAIRALLHWAVAEGIVDANVPKRIALPRKEAKILAIL